MSEGLVTHFAEQLVDISLAGYSDQAVENLPEALDYLESAIERLRDNIDEEVDKRRALGRYLTRRERYHE